MATNQDNGASDALDTLKKQNAALQRQVEELRTERDAYRKHALSLVKESITEEVVQGWMAEEKVEGSMLGFIDEVRNES